MSEPALVPAATLEQLAVPQLSAALRPLWEDAGPLVDRLVGRHVSSWAELISLAETEIDGMDDAERRALLAAHPRIGSDPAVLAARSDLSYREQGGGVGADPAILARLEDLNEEYETRFGFPFVEWVAGRSLAEMVPVIEARLTRGQDAELVAGCQALLPIARDRLRRIEG